MLKSVFGTLAKSEDSEEAPETENETPIFG